MANRIPHQLDRRAEFREELTINGTWIIDTLLPGGGIHILAGGSGAGKTTWLLQQLYEWSQGRPVLGFAGHPCNWAYISCDRTIRDLSETLKRIGLIKWDAPLYGIGELTDFQQDLTIELIMDHPLFVDTKFFIIEGFQVLIPDAPRGKSQNRHEMHWMHQLTDKCMATNKTILAVTHPPKQKSNEKFTSERSNVLGSVSIGATSGTMIWIRQLPVDDDDVKAQGVQSEDQRHVNIHIRNGKAIDVIYDLDERGRFVNPSMSNGLKATVATSLTNSVNHANLDMWLLSQPYREYQRKELVTILGNSFHVSESTVKRWLSGAIERGVMQQLGFGRYAKASSNGEQQQPTVQ